MCNSTQRMLHAGSTLGVANVRRREQTTNRSALALHDVVVSKVPEGHLLLVMTDTPGDSLSLLFRGTDWTVQYAVARGARLARTKGGNLWYTADSMVTFEYLETFRATADVHPS